MPRMYGACVALAGGWLARIQVAWPSVLIVLREGSHSHHHCAGASESRFLRGRLPRRKPQGFEFILAQVQLCQFGLPCFDIAPSFKVGRGAGFRLSPVLATAPV